MGEMISDEHSDTDDELMCMIYDVVEEPIFPIDGNRTLGGSVVGLFENIDRDREGCVSHL